MTTITIPDNLAFLNPNGFYFQIQKFPELNYYLQNVELPALTLGQATQVSSVHDVKLPGETMEFGTLNITFLIDDKMANYLAIHDWIIGLGYPQGHYQFNKLLADQRNSKSYSVNSKTMSDCTLNILDGNNVALKSFTFIDAFPTSLSAINLSSKNTDMQYIEASLSLEYSYYTVA